MMPVFLSEEGMTDTYIYIYLAKVFEKIIIILKKNNYILLGRWHRRILHCILIYFTFYQILMLNWADSNNKHVPGTGVKINGHLDTSDECSLT
jgi:hypothetical protein